jgi:hypothetical protein
MGHPEELLGAVLCIAAVLVAMRGRAVWAGVLLGLAIANKEWGLVAVGPVLLALPRERACGAVACAVTSGLIRPRAARARGRRCDAGQERISDRPDLQPPNNDVASGNPFLMFTGFSIPALIGMGIILYAPGTRSRVAARLGGQTPLVSPA